MVLPMGKPEAVACVSGEGKLCGCVKFYAAGCGCLVAAEIRGLPESDTGFFAFHIHEGGDCGGTDFSDTGGHFNPEKQAHPRHAGDLPPLLSDHGTATLLVQTSRFTPGEVIGRTVVIHQNPDDFHTQSAGRKIACGMIRRA